MAVKRKNNIKKYSELRFVDDFLFCKILSTNPRLCKELLEMILGIRISRVEVSESQKTLKQTYDGKGVRFDVYVEDNKNTVFDIEMQTTLKDDIPKRTRYYQGMLDLNLIEQGSKYSKLKKTYIIFICLSDPFKKNLPVYTFRNICEQDRETELGDEAVKVIVNASGNRTGLTNDMCDFLDYLTGMPPQSEFTRKLQGAVDATIANKEWEVEYMTLLMKINEEREDAGIIQSIRLLRRHHFSDAEIIEEIMSDFDLTEEEAKKRLEEYEDE